MKLEKCPRCGGNAEITTSRDLNVLQTYVICEECELITFNCESIAIGESSLNQVSYYEQIAKNYNEWAKTNPKSYMGERW